MLDLMGENARPNIDRGRLLADEKSTQENSRNIFASLEGMRRSSRWCRGRPKSHRVFQMPVMSGLTSSARIGKALPHVPILIYTIHKSQYLDSEARKMGIRGVISKSNPEALLRAVAALLGGDPNPGWSSESGVST